MPPVVKTLSVDYDKARQLVWFSGALDNGYKFSVGFPIAHIAMQFDEQASGLGYCGAPLCGDVVTIEGFFDNVARAAAYNPVVRQAANVAMQRVGAQAQHYGVSAVNHLTGFVTRRISHAAPAIGAKGLAAYHAAKVAAKAPPSQAAAIAANIRQMMANPTHPVNRLVLAGLHSAKV